MQIQGVFTYNLSLCGTRLKNAYQVAFLTSALQLAFTWFLYSILVWINVHSQLVNSCMCDYSQQFHFYTFCAVRNCVNYIQITFERWLESVWIGSVLSIDTIKPDSFNSKGVSSMDRPYYASIWKQSSSQNMLYHYYL